MNDELHINLRKVENTLTISGIAVILFGCWTLIKMALFLMLDNTEKLEMITSDDLFIQQPEILYIAYGSIAVFSFLIHLYIGRRAILEGKYKKNKRVYLFWAAILLLVSLLGIRGDVETVSYFSHFYRPEWRTAVASLLMDLTSFLILGQLIVSSIRVKAYRKKINEEMG